ncbi:MULTISPECIES: hypothetical protein [Lactobacillus]|nr:MULTISPECIES: hypothetical protein [Lactobacillus]
MEILIDTSTYDKLEKICKKSGDPISVIATRAINTYLTLLE